MSQEMSKSACRPIVLDDTQYGQTTLDGVFFQRMKIYSSLAASKADQME